MVRNTFWISMSNFCLYFRRKLKESGNYYGANGNLEIKVWRSGRERLTALSDNQIEIQMGE